MVDETKQNKRAHYVHRTSYSFQERIVGAFVLTALVILLGMLYSLGKNQHLFDDYFLIYGKLGSARGLSTETVIQVSGFDVGNVSSVEITDENDIIVTMKIYKRFHNLLRTDSQARVGGFRIAAIGKAVIEFNAGSNDLPLIKENTIIRIQEPFAIEDIITEVTSTLQNTQKIIEVASRLIDALDPEQIGKAVSRVSDTVQALEPAQIKETLRAVNKLSRNLQHMTDHIASGKGLIGAAVYDESLRTNIQESTRHLNNATDNLNTLLVTLRIDLEQFPELLEHIDLLLLEVDRTIRATQQIWPVSSTLPKAGQEQTLIDPTPAND